MLVIIEGRLMNATAKSLILKAQDCLDLAKSMISDDKQHDIAGYNLAQAAEMFLKALCSVRDLEFPADDEGHDLDNLMSILEEDGLAAVSSHADVVELTPYNALRAHVQADERLDLEEWMGYVEDLKTLVRDQAT
jgi:HEPN domain-containing protein